MLGGSARDRQTCGGGGEGRAGAGDSQPEAAREPPQGPNTRHCIQPTLERPGLHHAGTGGVLINTVRDRNTFSLPSDFLDIFFSLTYFILRTQYIITYEIGTNRLFYVVGKASSQQ